MNQDEFLHRCHQMTGMENEDSLTPESLIGFFQCFRPDGNAIESLFIDTPEKEDINDRLEKLYFAAGDDRRPDGGKDAYFVIRRSPPISPVLAEKLGHDWLEGLRSMTVQCGREDLQSKLASNIRVRVLEGIPPKHPKIESEQSPLLKTLRECSRITETTDCGIEASALRPAYYFIACDSMLRDYLMWPFYRNATGLEDPLAAYFELWRHGVKYRIFEDSQVDLYLPRQLQA